MGTLKNWRLPALLACLFAAGAAEGAPPPSAPRILLQGTGRDHSFLALSIPLRTFAQLQQPGSGSNVNLTQIGGASLSGSLYDSGNTALKVNCVVGCSATSGFSDNALFTAGTTSVNNISGVYNDSITNLSTGSAGALRATSDRMLYVNIGKIAGAAPSLTGSSLNVNCTGGCGSSSFADSAAFTPGTTVVTIDAGVFNDGLLAVSSGNAAAPRITSSRAFHVNLRNNTGTEIGTAANPVRVDPTGTTAQPVTGTFWQATQPVSGTVTANAGTGTFNIQANASVNVAQLGGTALSGANVVDTGNSAFKVNCVTGCSSTPGFTDNSAFTAGTTTEANVGGVFNDGLASVTSGNAAAARITNNRGLHVNLRNASGTEIGTSGTPVRVDPTGATTQPVSGTVTANQAGTWTVQPGNTANTTAWLVTGTGGTFPATQSGIWTVQPGNTANTTPWLTIDSSDMSGTTPATAPGKTSVVGGIYNSSAPTPTTGQTLPLQVDSAGRLIVNPAAVTGTGASGANIPRVTISNDSSLAANQSVNVSQINGVAPLMGNGTTGTGSPRVTIASDNSVLPAVGAGATGSAVPANAVYEAGAGTGNLTGYLNCDNTAIYDTTTNGSTQLVALTSGQVVYVCGYQFSTSQTTAVAVKLTYGTGTNCATGNTAMTPAYPLQAASSTGPIGLVVMTPGFRGLKTAASNALCVTTNAAASVQAIVWYTKF